jgi:hypothetical protein
MQKEITTQLKKAAETDYGSQIGSRIGTSTLPQRTASRVNES